MKYIWEMCCQHLWAKLQIDKHVFLQVLNEISMNFDCIVLLVFCYIMLPGNTTNHLFPRLTKICTMYDGKQGVCLWDEINNACITINCNG